MQHSPCFLAIARRKRTNASFREAVRYMQVGLGEIEKTGTSMVVLYHGPTLKLTLILELIPILQVNLIFTDWYSSDGSPSESYELTKRMYRVKWSDERHLKPAWAEKYFDSHTEAFDYF